MAGVQEGPGVSFRMGRDERREAGRAAEWKEKVRTRREVGGKGRSGTGADKEDKGAVCLPWTNNFFVFSFFTVRLPSTKLFFFLFSIFMPDLACY